MILLDMTYGCLNRIVMVDLTSCLTRTFPSLVTVLEEERMSTDCH